jgi:single-stranded DNA-binding protein
MSTITNCLVLDGTITGTPELRQTRNGADVYNARLMVPGMGRNAPGFIDIAVFDDALNAHDRFGARTHVTFTGRLHFQEWTTGEGAKRSTLSAIGTLAPRQGPATKTDQGENTDNDNPAAA